MRKTLGIAAVAISLTSGVTVVLAQSSRNLMEVTGTEANRVQTQYGRYPWVSRICVPAALAPPMALVSPALVICRNGFQRRYCNQLMSFMTGSGQAPHTGAVSLSAYRGWRAPLPRRKSTNPPADSCDRELT